MATQSGSSHRNSIAWQKGMDLAKVVYKATQTFPSDERFGLTNQLRRAAVSIPSNIAEGNGRLSTGELMQFLGIARGSALEVQTQLELAAMLGFGDTAEMAMAHALVDEEIRILNAALATLRARVAKKQQR
ncbi:MAG: four helix bundle protein [Acidobacteriaceae bacterium]